MGFLNSLCGKGEFMKRKSFLLRVKNQKELKALTKLVRDVTKKQLLLRGKYPISIEISLDLKVCQYKTLHGYVEHMWYSCEGKCEYQDNIMDFIHWYRHEYLITKNLYVIKHIPHASIRLPKPLEKNNHWYFLNDYKIPNLKMSDLYIDYLFSDIKGKVIKAPYTRLFCDIEKFKDNSKEPMSKFGQGYIYTKTYKGDDLVRFNKVNGVNWDKKIDEYYDNYHSKLNQVVKNALNKGKEVLILDLHSFSNEQAKYLGKKGPYPDICIGINDKYYTKPLLDLVISKIKAKGYTYKINCPYSGSIMPSDVLNGKLKGKVYSMMIEVNKRIYL